MTKKRNLTTFMIAIMIMLFSLPANAQGTVGYAKWDELNTTLTFYGGESVPDGAFALNTGGVAPKWSGNSSCTNVVFDESFKDAKPTSCYLWFEGFEQLKVIEGIEYLNTEKVTTMSHMFAGCKDLTSLDLSSFNTAEVTNMSNMFVGCSGLLSLGVSSFNTANVTDMSGMFVDCSNLTSLDLSSFNTAKVEVMGFMFNGCSGLTTIYVSDDFTTSAGTSGLGMFEGCRQLKGAASYDPAKTGIDMANFDGYFTPINITPYVKWDASTKVLTFKVANTKEEGVYDLNEGANAPGWNIYDVKNNCTKVVFTPSFNHAKPTSCCSWFSGFSNLTTIEGIENLNTEKVTDMSYMFNNCTGLTSLNLSSFNTAEVTKMNNMFKDCSSLTSLDLSNFDTSNVTNMSYMFYNCRELTSLNLSGFNTANVTNMSYMFSDCPNLRSLTLSSFFNTANVTDMSSMFRGCSSLTSLDLSKFNTDKVENMSSMFNGCSDLENLTLSSFNTDNVTDMSAMFGSCQKLTSLDLSKFNTANVTNMNNMFYGCGGLTALGLSSFNTANVTDMSCMFCWCSRLTSLDLSSFNTAKVEYMSYMFNGCSGLNSLNLSSFKTANVTNMNYMFNGCSGLNSLDLSSFTTANVTGMGNMFGSCRGLTSLDLSSFNTAKVTDMHGMFYGCSGLTSLNLSSFNTAAVTDMNNMFISCSGLTSLDVSNFNTANVTNMSNMFSDCRELTSLDLLKFNTANVTNMNDMFYGCGGLTALDLSSFNTANVTDMGSMFRGCRGLTYLDLSSFNTAKVTKMSYMFMNCSGLTKIYVSDNYETGKVTGSFNMFAGCSNLVGAASYSDSGKTGKDMANYTTGYFKTYFTLGDYKEDLFGGQLTTGSLDLSGEKDFVAHAPFTAKSATYSRDLSTSESTWFSLCLPFAYTPDNFNFTAYKLMSATADAVEIEEITGTIAAGTPVLFKFKDGVVDKTINLSATDANILKAPVDVPAVNGDGGSSLQLCGTYQTKSFSSEDNNAFILLNDKLMNPARMLTTPGVTGVSVKPFRAYMTLTASAQTSSARAFSIGRGGEGDEGTTAIDLLNSVATDDAEYYDINGRRIDAPAKGVNIVRRGNKTIKLIIK